MPKIGVSFRVNRGGKWQSVDLSEMDESEIKIELMMKSNQFLLELVMTLLRDRAAKEARSGDRVGE